MHIRQSNRLVVAAAGSYNYLESTILNFKAFLRLLKQVKVARARMTITLFSEGAVAVTGRQRVAWTTHGQALLLIWPFFLWLLSRDLIFCFHDLNFSTKTARTPGAGHVEEEDLRQNPQVRH